MSKKEMHTVCSPLQLLALFLAVAEGSDLLQPPEGIVYYPDARTSCTLPCTVQLNSSLLTPRVSWYHRPGAFGEEVDYFKALSDTEFWEQRSSDYQYCKYPHIYHREFLQPSDFDCIAAFNETGSQEDDQFTYNCDVLLDECFFGDYECRVTAENDEGNIQPVVTKEIAVQSHPASLGVDRPSTDFCFHPTVTTITAKLVDIAEDPQPKLNLTWEITEKPISVGCKFIFCPKSRQFQVKMLQFDSAPFGNAQHSKETAWLRTAKRRETYYLFDTSEYSPTKYYQFVVRNVRDEEYSPNDDGNMVVIESLPYMDPTQNKTSRIFYFGEQEKARLTEPQGNVDYLVGVGDTKTVRCSGTGKPTPTLTLFAPLNNGQLQTVKQADSNIEHTLIIYDTQYKLYCNISNFVVNESGEVEHATSQVSITISAISGANKDG